MLPSSIREDRPHGQPDCKPFDLAKFRYLCNFILYERYHIEDLSACPANNTCALTQPGGEPCGTDAHLPPLAVAERLCPTALQQRLPDPETFTLQGVGAVQFFHTRLAWGRAEQALNPGLSTPAADSLFAAAENHADTSLALPGGFGFKLESTLLKLNLEALRARRPGAAALSDQGWAQIERGIAVLAADACVAPIHTEKTHSGHWNWPNHRPCFDLASKREGVLARLGLGLLCLKAGLRVYATSMRENGGKTEYPRRNHDWYDLVSPAVKVPVKAVFSHKGRRGNDYDPRILHVNFAAFTRSAYVQAIANGYRIEGYEPQDIIPPTLVVQWISRAALRQSVSQEKYALVQSMTNLLRKEISKQRRQSP